MVKGKAGVHILSTLMLTVQLLSARSQEVSIPDPGLNAAIRRPFGVGGQTALKSNF